MMGTSFHKKSENSSFCLKANVLPEGDRGACLGRVARALGGSFDRRTAWLGSSAAAGDLGGVPWRCREEVPAP